MTDLSAYRERFAAVGEYESLWTGEDGSTVLWKRKCGLADAALTALAKALGEAEAELDVLSQPAPVAALRAELAAYRSDQADDYAEDKRELERKYTAQMKRAEKAEAELAETRDALCALTTEHLSSGPWCESCGRVTDQANSPNHPGRCDVCAELAELKARRCETCRENDVNKYESRTPCPVCLSPQVGERRGELLPRPADFACNHYERREG